MTASEFREFLFGLDSEADVMMAIDIAMEDERLWPVLAAMVCEWTINPVLVRQVHRELLCRCPEYGNTSLADWEPWQRFLDVIE